MNSRARPGFDGVFAAFFKVLSEHGPLNRQDLTDKVAALIPPEVAIRRYYGLNRKEKIPEVSQTLALDRGRRKIVAEVIHRMLGRDKFIEVNGDGLLAMADKAKDTHVEHCLPSIKNKTLRAACQAIADDLGNAHEHQRLGMRASLRILRKLDEETST